MKKITILSLLLTLVTLTLNAEEPITLKKVSIMGEKNLDIRFNVIRERFLNTPPWDGLSKLPLSVNKAINIAITDVSKRYPGKKISIDEIELKNKSTTSISRWYYVIEFKGDIPKEAMRLTILLDGSIVKPTITVK